MTGHHDGRCRCTCQLNPAYFDPHRRQTTTTMTIRDPYCPEHQIVGDTHPEETTMRHPEGAAAQTGPAHPLRQPPGELNPRAAKQREAFAGGEYIEDRNGIRYAWHQGTRQHDSYEEVRADPFSDKITHHDLNGTIHTLIGIRWRSDMGHTPAHNVELGHAYRLVRPDRFDDTTPQDAWPDFLHRDDHRTAGLAWYEHQVALQAGVDLRDDDYPAEHQVIQAEVTAGLDGSTIRTDRSPVDNFTAGDPAQPRRGHYGAWTRHRFPGFGRP